MRNQSFGLAFSIMLFALCFSAEAQQPKKIPRIGFLGAASMSANSARIEAFRQGLRELGYVEGKNIVIEYRYADGKSDRLPALAMELVGLKVDVIISGGGRATRPAKEATATIPIVMTGAGDPVGLRFVASLARPGGNITGLSTFSPELSGKRLELVKESVSKLSRVAVFGTSATADTAQVLKEVERAAGALRVKLQYVDVVDPKHINTAFQSASKGRAEALIVLGSAAFIAHRTQVVELAAKYRLPTMYNRREYVETGGADVLRREFGRFVPSRRYLRGQSPKRHQARRSARRAAEKIRVHHQSKGSEADRINHSAQCAGKSGQSDSVNKATVRQRR